MKAQFNYLLLIPFMLMACGGEESQDQHSESGNDEMENVPVEEVEIINSITISPNLVGIFELGKKVPAKLPDELRIRQFTHEETVGDKTVELTHNVIFNQLEDVVELYMDQGSSEHHDQKVIKEMLVLSNYYETAEGISVGSTVEEFRETYPNATVWYSGDFDRYVLETEDILGAQFILDPADMKRKSKGLGMTKLDFGNVKKGAEIKKIRLY